MAHNGKSEPILSQAVNIHVDEQTQTVKFSQRKHLMIREESITVPYAALKMLMGQILTREGMAGVQETNVVGAPAQGQPT